MLGGGVGAMGVDGNGHGGSGDGVSKDSRELRES
jgi:hypothetical protein